MLKRLSPNATTFFLLSFYFLEDMTHQSLSKSFNSSFLVFVFHRDMEITTPKLAATVKFMYDFQAIKILRTSWGVWGKIKYVWTKKPYKGQIRGMFYVTNFY